MRKLGSRSEIFDWWFTGSFNSGVVRGERTQLPNGLEPSVGLSCGLIKTKVSMIKEYNAMHIDCPGSA